MSETRCNEKLKALNLPMPRTCRECGLGPCSEHNRRQETPLNLQSTPVPICAVCNRPVERFTRYSPGNPQHAIRFTVECHGDREETIVTLDQLSAGGELQPSIAFKPSP